MTNPPKLLPNGDTANYCNTNDCRTVLVHSGAFAKYVGRIDLVVHVGTNNADPENRSRIVSVAYDNQPVATYPPGDPNYIPDDPDIANLMWPYSVKLNQDIDLNGVFAYIDPPGTAKIVRNDPSGGDSQLGNLVARSMQLQTGVDAQFAFTNSLGIRADFERGPLTNEDMYNVFPFENTIVVVYMSGQEVKDTLDFVSAKSATRGCLTQLQSAGITFDMVCQDDPTGPDPCNVIDPELRRHPVQHRQRLRARGSGDQRRHARVNDRCDTTQQHRCVQTACNEENIYIGDQCRPRRSGDQSDRDRSSRRSDDDEVRAARDQRPLPRRRQQLHRGRRLGLPRPQAQHVAAGHRRVAARCADGVPVQRHAAHHHDVHDRTLLRQRADHHDPRYERADVDV